MPTPTEEARIEGIRTKLQNHEYYGIAISDITWLLAQVHKYQSWHQENLRTITELSKVIEGLKADQR